MAYTYERKTDQRGLSYIEITGSTRSAARLSIPAQLEELPVKSIGGGAFKGREDLVEVWLPETLESLGSYAFYNCKSLRAIHLTDGVEDYSDGAIKQCGSLREIFLTIRQGNYRVMREMLSDNDRQLTFLLKPEGARLTFPAYVYNFVEDVEARVLHHKIEGSGYPYRECVTRRGVKYQEYDRLFSQVVSDDEGVAWEIALGRLSYPHELGERSRGDYADYLGGHMDVVLAELIRDGREEELRFLCGADLIPETALSAALALSAEQKRSESAAILMEYWHRRFAGGNGAGALTLEW